MKLFEDDIREFDEHGDISRIDIKVKLMKLHLKGYPKDYLYGFVDCIAHLQLICIDDWDNLKEYIEKIQACN